MSESYTSTITALREELAGAQKENEELRRENGKQRETINRANARMAALTEENEELRKERDSLRQQLQEAKEQHETELREVTEEMAAAARFSGSEWQEHCDRVEAEGQRLRSVIVAVSSTALELLPWTEEAARQKLEEEEVWSRRGATQGKDAALDLLPAVDVYRFFVSSAPSASIADQRTATNARLQLHWLCRALGYTREELHSKFLGKAKKNNRGRWYDTSAPSRGLWELYLTLREVGFPSDGAMATLLETEEQLDFLLFDAVGHAPEYEEYNYAIPPTADAYDFFHRLLRHLPKLNDIRFAHLPPLSSPGVLDQLRLVPPTLQFIGFDYVDYTVADLRRLRACCPAGTEIHVHSANCTDWGEFAGVADARERETQLVIAFDGAVFWNE